MKNPTQEELLGYVLGALDAQEHRDLQMSIDQNPEIEDRLLQIKASLVPLDALETSGPRVGLARRTCEAVANWQNSQSESGTLSPADLSVLGPSIEDIVSGEFRSDEPCGRPKRTVRLRVTERLLTPSSWSIPDVLVGMALVAVCAGILFPTISYTRTSSRIVACQDNLRKVGVAMMNYSDINEGEFVAIPPSGNLAASGCYAPILKDAGLVEEDSIFSCAGIAATDSPVHIPSRNQIEAAKHQQEIANFQKKMGGHYGYTIGYCEGNKYVTPRYMGRSNVVLLADQPSVDLAGHRSANHNGRGQNCLFEDGRVLFVKGHSYAGDALFLNDYGIVAPGSNARDNVIAPSHLTVQARVLAQ